MTIDDEVFGSGALPERSDQHSLHENAVEAIRTGRLPRRRPDRLWGGPGQGLACALCGEIVGKHETELEIEFTVSDGKTPERGGQRFHPPCFAVWESEVARLAPTLPATMSERDDSTQRAPEGRNGRRSA
jgi:hypothetical protein